MNEVIRNHIVVCPTDRNEGATILDLPSSYNQRGSIPKGWHGKIPWSALPITLIERSEHQCMGVKEWLVTIPRLNLAEYLNVSM